MGVIYTVIYAINDLTLQCGTLGGFTNLFAAEKFKRNAETALRNSGHSGIIEISTTIIGDHEDPAKFFEEL